MSWTLAEIAQHVNGQVVGDPEYLIRGVGTLTHAGPEQISFLANNKYKKYLATTGAGAVIVAAGTETDAATNLIVVDDAYVAYARAATMMHPLPKAEAGIHPSAWVHPEAHVAETASIAAQVTIERGAVIAEDVAIGPGSVIEADVKIGRNSIIKANVTLCREVQIGERVVIHPGVVIGADGFGIANDQGRWIKVPQVGRVIIGDDVEIGANTTIDRGAIDDTVIGQGVKLDNQIQIGHNVTIGDHTVIAGCVGIAGSTHIGSYCAIGGGTGIAGHIEIADGVQLTGMSMVTKSISEAGVYSSGIPIEPARQWHKNVIRYRQMDKLFERVTLLEKRLKD
ncbi:UDP-3-O-(3-hydroxymyristoyl)glucosamine N-acyltransferase [Methylophaga sp.]|uniref:UDP-3-O-(3-hydroxymyristoyl)glucosamine N-acyltransferase n=1 Tax=Methylophaga sp. TaxID=2024840 RepID=UPI0013FE5289|nr:UDP-3-O-(3-hydroxymyristoyl)glucosamine N-acyltransferase [Methylophaga sp.]MTI62738.1 UDP-3-O-(3-hydroxymyristoyl)glucosamine N-acyltransferase [Methylophaga sp.]